MSEASTDVEVLQPEQQGLLAQPIWDRLHERQKALLRSKAPKLNDAELAQGVELAAAYKLDPYANEIWFVKDDSGRVMIVTGRDGLRKVVQRNGLEMDCDVVRTNDTFKVERTSKRERLVTHSYEGATEQRGDIVGAWAEVWERKTGNQRGYFFAPLSEYRPPNPHPKSVWAKQVSVMILAAAERQASRQATPLGGLLVEGEDELVNDRAAARLGEGSGDGSEPGWNLSEEAEELLPLVEQRIVTERFDRGTTQLELNQQPRVVVEGWLNSEARETDAHVVADPEPAKWEKETAWKRLGELYTIRDELEAAGDYTGDAGVKHQATVGEIDQLEDEFGEPGAEDSE